MGKVRRGIFKVWKLLRGYGHTRVRGCVFLFCACDSIRSEGGSREENYGAVPMIHESEFRHASQAPFEVSQALLYSNPSITALPTATPDRAHKISNSDDAWHGKIKTISFNYNRRYSTSTEKMLARVDICK